MSDLPSHPPEYEASHTGFQQFEIDDTATRQNVQGSRLAQILQNLKTALVTCMGFIMAPVLYYSRPLREAYAFASFKFEQYILKVGNPLVVKRLLYVSFVVVLMYAVSMNENSDGINGASGGAFSSGKFYDVPQLADSLHQYIDPKTLKENTEYLSSIPHLAGSTGDLALARYVESYFTNNGLETVEFNEMDTFLNYPKKDHTYVKLDDGSFAATLHEERDSEIHFLAFSPDSPASKGEIHQPYVFANYGSPSDFKKLKDAGVDLKDAILLVRYGGNVSEGNKVAEATNRGASAVVFITEPIEWAGKKHDSAIQRMNVALSRLSPGYVLTPGSYSKDDFALRVKWADSASTAKIPCVPISWKDGEFLVRNLGQEGVDFGDGLFSGSSPSTRDKKVARMKLSVQNDERSTHSIWNVVGSIPGREQTNKGIIFGAPRDSLCYGASTSASSTAALLELVKVFTSLQRRYSWSPSRTIYFISFDATEYNLAGSAEWVKNKKQELTEQGYAYVEVNGLANGDILDVNANPLLHDVIRGEMQRVKANSKKSESLYDAYLKSHESEMFPYNLMKEKNYVPFVNMLNIPSMEISYRGSGPENSCLDTFSNWGIQTGSDTLKMQIMVELLARIGLRLAEEPLIPYNFVTLSNSLQKYQKNLEQHVEKIMAQNSDAVQSKLNFQALTKAIQSLGEKSKTLEEFRLDWKTFIETSSSLEPVMLAATRRSANDNMVFFNTFFVSSTSAVVRAGYLNSLFGFPYDAPVNGDGVYSWNTFPRVRDYVAKGDLFHAQREVDDVASMIEESAQVLTRFS